MTGTKFGCGIGLCGACTIRLDGQADALLHHAGVRRSRQTDHDDRSDRSYGDRQDDPSAPGSRSTCRNAVTANPARSCLRARCWRPIAKPTDADIDDAMAGNICRCGTYLRIRAAIKQAAGIATTASATGTEA